MSQEIYPVLKQLFHDHGNMFRVLAALELEIDRHSSSGKFDSDLIKLILEYVLTYPDLRHHPREDKLLERMLMKNPLVAKDALDLILEHEHLAEISRRLAAAFHNLLHDQCISLEELDDIAKRYIAESRQHMRREEASFFLTAVHALSFADWDYLAEKSLPQTDLVSVGDHIDSDYQALHDRILELSKLHLGTMIVETIPQKDSRSTYD